MYTVCFTSCCADILPYRIVQESYRTPPQGMFKKQHSWSTHAPRHKINTLFDMYGRISLVVKVTHHSRTCDPLSRILRPHPISGSTREGLAGLTSTPSASTPKQYRRVITVQTLPSSKADTTWNCQSSHI